jgi:hypothetical protein
VEKLEQANPTSKLNQKSNLPTQLAEARQKKLTINSRKRSQQRKATRKTLKNHHDIVRQNPRDMGDLDGEREIFTSSA